MARRLEGEMARRLEGERARRLEGERAKWVRIGGFDTENVKKYLIYTNKY